MTAFGAVLGLIIAIILIMRKANPDYSLILGSIIGGLTDDAVQTHEKGIDSFFSIINYPITLEEAMKKETAEKFVKGNNE